MLRQASLQKGRAAPTAASAVLAEGLRKLASDITARPSLVDAAADEMAQARSRSARNCWRQTDDQKSV